MQISLNSIFSLYGEPIRQVIRGNALTVLIIISTVAIAIFTAIIYKMFQSNDNMETSKFKKPTEFKQLFENSSTHVTPLKLPTKDRVSIPGTRRPPKRRTTSV